MGSDDASSPDRRWACIAPAAPPIPHIKITSYIPDGACACRHRGPASRRPGGHHHGPDHHPTDHQDKNHNAIHTQVIITRPRERERERSVKLGLPPPIIVIINHHYYYLYTPSSQHHQLTASRSALPAAMFRAPPSPPSPSLLCLVRLVSLPSPLAAQPPSLSLLPFSLLCLAWIASLLRHPSEVLTTDPRVLTTHYRPPAGPLTAAH